MPRSLTMVPVAVVAAVGLLAAACSSAPAHRSGVGAHHRSTTPTTTASPATTSTGASSSTSSGASTTCTAAQLAGAVTGMQGGAGTLELTVALRNSSSSSCTMDGYAGLQLLGSGGAQLPTDTHQGGGLAFESVAPSPVDLAPGQVAYFNIGFSDVPTAGQTSCPSATGLQVIPPGATAITVPVQVQACAGTLDESAVFGAGSPATQTTAPPTSS